MSAGGNGLALRSLMMWMQSVNSTASAMCLGGSATKDDAEVVRPLFSSVGVMFKASFFLLVTHTAKKKQSKKEVNSKWWRIYHLLSSRCGH